MASVSRAWLSWKRSSRVLEDYEPLALETGGGYGRFAARSFRDKIEDDDVEEFPVSADDEDFQDGYDEIDENDRWCRYSSGPTTIPDHRTGQRHDVHVSAHRDGSVWVRVGTAQLDWTAINERRQRIQASVLGDSAVDALRFLLRRRRQHPDAVRRQSATADLCALTDVELSLTVVGGWNPSYVATIDADGGGRGRHGGSGRPDTRIFSIRNTRGDCRTSASLFLSADKQVIRCDGGSAVAGLINACGQRIVAERGYSSLALPPLSFSPSGDLPQRNLSTLQHSHLPEVGSPPLSPANAAAAARVLTADSVSWTPPSRSFLKYVSMDPNGTDHWYCRQHQEHNRFSLIGSYYYVYVRVATCPPPLDSRSLGDEIALRPNSDTWRNAVLLPDPTKTVLSDSIIQAWQIYVKSVSIEHGIYLQVWRRLSEVSATTTASPAGRSAAANSTVASGALYVLVGQTFIEPTELRFREIVLRADQFIRVARGDVIGIYFPQLNPIGWSSVPCSSAAQRFAFVHAPRNVTIGAGLHFQSATSSSMKFSPGREDLCRYYSFAALFANRSHSKVVEDHQCPPATTTVDHRSTSRGVIDFDTPVSPHSSSFERTSNRDHPTSRHPGSPGSKVRDATSGGARMHSSSSDRQRYGDHAGRLATDETGDEANALEGGPAAIFYALLVAAGILLSMIIVGTISYCVASATGSSTSPSLSSR